MNKMEWSDFSKIDIRIGTVTDVKEFPEARNPAFQLKVDFGELGVKKTSAQIKGLYTKESLLGKQVVAVVNFPPKQIANFMSECLILGGLGNEKEVILLQPERNVFNGMKVG